MSVRSGPGGSSPVGPIDSRALILIGAAVVIGLLLLAKGFDTGGGTVTATGPTTDTAADTADGGDAGGDTVAPGDTTTSIVEGTDTGTAAPGDTTVTTPPTLRDPSEVTVLVANGSGEPGVAGVLQERLTALNYVADAANAQASSASQILYREGLDADAAALAEAIGAPATTLRLLAAGEVPPVAADAVDRANTSDVVIIMGSDAAIR